MSTTQIEFVEGLDPASPIPSFVRAAGLNRRLAVIQHTCRPDSVDMYFDEPLWRRLIEFAVRLRAGSQVAIIDRDHVTVDRNWQKRTAQDPARSEELPLEGFMSAWSASDDPNRDPPEYITVRDEGNLVLCIATEYWTQAGGPARYADSYTYSIFSEDDIASKVISFLGEADAARGWELSTSPLQAGGAP